MNKCNEWKEKYPVCLPEYDDDTEGINYYKFIDMLSDVTSSETPLISDAGSSFYVTAQASKLKEGQRLITSGAMATMGFGVPAAIGVAVANSNNITVSVTGDGSFQQNLQELSVIAYHKLPIKLFVVNNNAYLSIRQTQRNLFNENFVGESPASGVPMPDIKKLAAAFGIAYKFISKISELKKYLPEILSNKDPMIIEIKSIDNQKIQPTNSSMIKPDGTMVSKPLEDMSPFLDREEFLRNMIVKPIEE